MEEKEKSCLEELKEEYNFFKEKYSLPEFEELNRDFSIEKISESETEFILKEVRRYMFDKFSVYMRLYESLLHPVNASVFIFSIIKTLNSDDKKTISDLYKKLMKIEIGVMEADIEYNEEIEAKFIKDSFEVWNQIKKDWKKVLDSVNSNWDNKVENNNKGYFG